MWEKILPWGTPADMGAVEEKELPTRT